MNRLEELSKKNSNNYRRYLKRMTESMKHSTKGVIPLLVEESNNILDVGCGSGVMLDAIEKVNPTAKLTGLDLNIDAINRLKKYNKKWKLYHMDFMDLDNAKFDAIIFSSILHEISSYNSDLDKRFTEKPIIEAFKKSNLLLEDNGVVIVRDGLLSSLEDRNNKRIISFTNAKDCFWLYRFRDDFRGFDNLNIDTRILKLDGDRFLVSEGFLKEFLCTYTWGEESYHREVNERFGILTKDEWITFLKKSGFEIDTIIESKEEYEKYLSKKVTITDLDGNPYIYPNMTITIKAKKIKSLKK